VSERFEDYSLVRVPRDDPRRWRGEKKEEWNGNFQTILVGELSWAKTK